MSNVNTAQVAQAKLEALIEAASNLTAWYYADRVGSNAELMAALADAIAEARK